MIADLTDRRSSELKTVLSLVVGIAVTTWSVATLLRAAWRPDSIGRQVILSVIGVLGISSLVPILTGCISGWLLLLLFDRSRRIQKPAFVLILVMFYVLMFSSGFWGGSIDWVDATPLVALGLVGGLGVGAATLVISREREFPIAATGIHTLALGVVIVGIVDVVTAENPLATMAGADRLLGGIPLLSAGVQIAGALAFVLLLAFLMQSRDQHRVVIISSHDGIETAVGVGLKNVIQNKFEHSVISAGGTAAANAPGRMMDNQRPDPLREEIAFKYKSPQLLSRWVKVVVSPEDISHLEPSDISSSGVRTPVSVLKYALGLLLVPYRDLARVVHDPNSAISSIEEADTVVFAVSARDFVPADIPFDNLRLRELHTPAYIETMSEVADRLNSKVRRLLVVYDAKTIVSVYENRHNLRPSLDGREFREMVGTRLSPFYVDETVLLDSRDTSDLVEGIDVLQVELDTGGR